MVSRLAAARRGWEGPFRYRIPGDHERWIFGWVMHRGRKCMHFYSNTDQKKIRLPLDAERDLVSVAPADVRARFEAAREAAFEAALKRQEKIR